MSCITEIEKRALVRNTIQDKTSAKYCVFEENGNKYFQIDTYGSEDRECPGKVSQTIRFDETIAKKLVSILIEELWN
jgi:hypothetical protein